MASFVILFVFLCVGYFFGKYREEKHYSSIIGREKLYLSFPVSSVDWKTYKKDNPNNYNHSQLVMGQTVIANDYFKIFVAGLRNIIGGRMKTYESLLDRGRREAILRLIEEANKLEAQEIINLRIETTNINQGDAQKGAPIIEVLAYGTALK